MEVATVLLRRAWGMQRDLRREGAILCLKTNILESFHSETHESITYKTMRRDDASESIRLSVAMMEKNAVPPMLTTDIPLKSSFKLSQNEIYLKIIKPFVCQNWSNVFTSFLMERKVRITCANDITPRNFT